MLKLKQHLRLKQQYRIAPKLIMSYNILRLSSGDLQQLIEKEIIENPALEWGKESKIDSSLVSAQDKTAFPVFKDEQNFIDGLSFYLDLNLQNPLDKKIGYYIINNLTNGGYLEITPSEIASRLGVSPEQVSRILEIIHTIEPGGIAARNIQQSFLCQLKLLKESPVQKELLGKIFNHYWNDFKKQHWEKIASHLQIKEEELKQIITFIKNNFFVYPAYHYHFQAEKKEQYIVPDIIIDSELKVEVCQNQSLYLYVNPLYKKLCLELENQTFADKEHILKYISQAKMFIDNVNRRFKTIELITKQIIQHQHEFFEHQENNLYLKPLTREKIAADLGFHKSTVSRAINNKFIQLPSKRVVALEVFFHKSSAVKEMIKSLILTENAPLTDQEMVLRLKEQGIKVARRTVAKYRNEIGLLSSHYRRKREYD